jgi:hypothetical protein
LWTHEEKGERWAEKPPLPVTQHPEGVCQHTRRLETIPTRRAYQRGGVSIVELLLQGLLPHGSSYHEALELHTYC